jgi:hypothetical protein
VLHIFSQHTMHKQVRQVNVTEDAFVSTYEDAESATA